MPEEIVSGVLRLVGYRAYRWDFQEETSNLTIWVRQARIDFSGTSMILPVEARIVSRLIILVRVTVSPTR